jgi:hypothetical protein
VIVTYGSSSAGQLIPHSSEDTAKLNFGSGCDVGDVKISNSNNNPGSTEIVRMNGNYKFKYRLSDDKQFVTISALCAIKGNNWMAFGISTSGQMTNSEVVLGSADGSAQGKVGMYKVPSKSTPVSIKSTLTYASITVKIFKWILK